MRKNLDKYRGRSKGCEIKVGKGVCQLEKYEDDEVAKDKVEEGGGG